MIFYKNDIRCSIVRGEISHRGPLNLFEVGEELDIGGVHYVVTKKYQSKRAEGFNNALVSEVEAT
jgi:hypothetical protein